MRKYLTFFSLLCCGFYSLVSAWDSEESYIEAVAQQKPELSIILDRFNNSDLVFICSDFKIPPQSSPNPTNPIPLPQVVVTASEATSASGSVISAVAGSSISAVQVARTMSVAKILMCNNYTRYEGEQLDWPDSPTQLSLGRGLLRYPFGAVIGNTGIVVIAESVLAGLAKWKGAEKMRFPGALIVPVLLLSTQTTTAATTLLRYGNTTYQILGGGMIAAQVIGGGAIAWFLWPSRFAAQLNPSSKKWVDLSDPGYVGKYGMLFRDYRDGRYGFILAELSMNLASGMLAGYVPDQSACGTLAWVATGVYGGYALGTLVLMPYLDTVDKIYFTLVPIAQTIPLVIYASSDINAEEPTTAQEVASTIPVALYWVTCLRSIYDVAIFVKDIYKFYHRVRKPLSADMLGDDNDVPLLPMSTNPLDTTDGI